MSAEDLGFVDADAWDDHGHVEHNAPESTAQRITRGAVAVLGVDDVSGEWIAVRFPPLFPLGAVFGGPA